jgi:hypothetical protein
LISKIVHTRLPRKWSDPFRIELPGKLSGPAKLKRLDFCAGRLHARRQVEDLNVCSLVSLKVGQQVPRLVESF